MLISQSDSASSNDLFIEQDASRGQLGCANLSLQDLQRNEGRQIMDLVNKLRRDGLSKELELPQLVVCGDQSSGKSSVLEAISGIPFPRKENLCTRFATEIIMRNEEDSYIRTSIIPDKSKSLAERESLENFAESINDFSALPELIDKATCAMGLNDPTSKSVRAFTEDVLSIEISGPDLPQLTLVDLPGLIHAETKSQTDADVQLIRSLVVKYISNKRTIILAVISAKNDYANQIILKYCRRFDPKGHRTLGIITKPDFLTSGSANEQSWIELAKNEDVRFELGWHMLKNRGDSQLHFTLEERKAAESVFFSRESYKELDPKTIGIEALIVRLSEVLSRHLTAELPGLKDELESKLAVTDKELLQLGRNRATLEDQKQYLMKISVNLHDILKSAVNGFYDRELFGAIDMNANIDAPTNLARLRAVVQNLNLEFANRMLQYGHKFSIAHDSHIEENTNQEQHNPKAATAGSASQKTIKRGAQEDFNGDHPRPKKRSRSEAVDDVLGALQRCRGSELPGTFNPLLISQLFWQQSEPWEKLAQAHISVVAAKCQAFVFMMLKEVAPADISMRLYSHVVEPSLKSAVSESRMELAKIVEDKKRHAMTYNHCFTNTLQEIRREKYDSSVRNLTENAVVEGRSMSSHRIQTFINFATFEKNLQAQAHNEPDMDRFSAEEALDSQEAFYKDELKYFVDVVTKQVIERHLVHTIPAEIFSPVAVAQLSDRDIHYLAAESPQISQRRKILGQRKATLEKGRDAFRLALITSASG